MPPATAPSRIPTGDLTARARRSPRPPATPTSSIRGGPKPYSSLGRVQELVGPGAHLRKPAHRPGPYRLPRVARGCTGRSAARPQQCDRDPRCDLEPHLHCASVFPKLRPHRGARRRQPLSRSPTGRRRERAARMSAAPSSPPSCFTYPQRARTMSSISASSLGLGRPRRRAVRRRLFSGAWRWPTRSGRARYAR